MDPDGPSARALLDVELAERIEPELVGRDQARWLAVCEAEHENMRAAFAACPAVSTADLYVATADI